jgi:cytochrome c
MEVGMAEREIKFKLRDSIRGWVLSLSVGFLTGSAFLFFWWAEAARGQSTQNLEGDPQLGRQALEDYGCGACHVIPGVPGADSLLTPTLEDWADRRFIAGQVINNPENLIFWIQNPPTIKPGTAMQDLNVSDQDARHMSAYLFTLSRRTGFIEFLDSIFPFQVRELHIRLSPIDGPDVPVEMLPAERVALIQAGIHLYSRQCAVCHGFFGEGRFGSYPPLDQNPFVTDQDPAQVIDIVLHGRGAMPGFREQLHDRQVAAVISFIRNAWGNTASVVISEEVEGVSTSR